MKVMPKDNSNAPGLIRDLGAWSATAVVVGSMIGQAVFLVSSDMARELGPISKVLILWIVGGGVLLFGTLCYAELGAAMPEARVGISVDSADLRSRSICDQQA